jgi:hypothetical protein
MFYELFRVDVLRRCHQIVISVIVTPAVFPFKIPTLVARKNEEEEPWFKICIEMQQDSTDIDKEVDSRSNLMCYQRIVKPL